MVLWPGFRKLGGKSRVVCRDPELVHYRELCIAQCFTSTDDYAIKVKCPDRGVVKEA